MRKEELERPVPDAAVALEEVGEAAGLFLKDDGVLHIDGFMLFEEHIHRELGVLAHARLRPAVLTDEGGREHHAAAHHHLADAERRTRLTVEAAVADIPEARDARDDVLRDVGRVVVPSRQHRAAVIGVVHAEEVIGVQNVVRIKADKRLHVGVGLQDDGERVLERIPHVALLGIGFLPLDDVRPHAPCNFRRAVGAVIRDDEHAK